jgi:molecular chaperone GrpE
MENGKAEEEVEQTAATEANPEAEVVDAEVVDQAESPEETGEEASGEATPEDEVAKAKAEAADWQGKYLRLHAEWDTYRRRMKDQREEEKVHATGKLVEDLIPVLDDFERTVDYAKSNGEEGLLGGVEAVQTKFKEVLVKQGLEIIDPVGQPYEALEAQAVGTVDNPNVPDETVEQVFQKGYRMGKKVLRPAMVTIAVGGPKREVDEEQAQE